MRFSVNNLLYILITCTTLASASEHVNADYHNRLTLINNDIETLKQSNKVYKHDINTLSKILEVEKERYLTLEKKYALLSSKLEKSINTIASLKNENSSIQNSLTTSYQKNRNNKKYYDENILSINKKILRLNEKKVYNSLYPIEVIKTVTKEIGCRTKEVFPTLVQRESYK
jgi:chromosome segregation ATPase